MNKNNLLKIAKTIYLQDIVSKQLFAETWNPNKNIDDSVGSFRSSQKLATCYQAFIGQEERTPTIQFIQKNGMNFKVHKLNLTQSKASQQLMADNLPLNKVAWFLTSLQSFVNKNAGKQGLQQAILGLYRTCLKYEQEIKGGRNGKAKKHTDEQALNIFVNQINDQFDAIFGNAKRLSKIVSNDDPIFSESISTISTCIQVINKMKQQNKLTFDNLPQQLQPILQMCQNIMRIFNDANSKRTLKSLTTNASRMAMLNKMYGQAVDAVNNSQSQIEKEISNKVKTAIQTCNTVGQLQNFDIELAKHNLQDYYKIMDRSYKEQSDIQKFHQKQYQLQNAQRYSRNQFISFLSGYTKSIKFDVFDKAYMFYKTYCDKVQNDQTEQLYNKLSDLDQLVEKLRDDVPNKDKLNYDIKSNDKTLFYSDLYNANKTLMDQFKTIVEYF